jgi:hypothetical protein
MMNGRVQTEEVEGVVEGVNATGLKIGGAWVNVSRFHPVELPEAGAHVRLKVDSKGYIVALEQVSPSTPAVVSARDDRITRLAVLKAAASFAADRTDIKSADVLRIADAWLKWVLE